MVFLAPGNERKKIKYMAGLNIMEQAAGNYPENWDIYV
jgi:hypothetical protein